MSKIIAVLCLLYMQSMYSMYSMASRGVSTHPRYALNTHENFGKRHFIVGYQQPNKVSQQRGVSQKRAVPNRKNKPSSTESFFTSVHDVRAEVAKCLERAKKSICVATYVFTDAKIADQLIRAHKSQIKVMVVTDKERMRDKHSKIRKLVACDIPVYYYSPLLNPNPRQKRATEALMHHKFTIIDDSDDDNKILMFGSLNFTKAAQEENMENVTIA